MKNKTLHRHDISDKTSEIIEPHLPRRASIRSRPAKDNHSHKYSHLDIEEDFSKIIC